MSAASEQKTNPPVLCIVGELSIYRAEELKQALLGEPSPIEVDLSGVTDIDTAGVQLLMLAKRAAQAAQRELRLVAHSPVVNDVFELLNLGAYFDDPLVMASSASATRSPNPKTAARHADES